MARIFADRVKQISTTTGLGPFVVSVTPTGFRPFSAKCAVGDTFDGSIVASNGEWQSGTFTYSAANQVTTLTVQDSSNAGAAVTFGAGDKEIFIGMTAGLAALMRERLTGNRTYYVATTGNDSNDGLTVGAPFLTIQKAIDVAVTLDLSIFSVTIRLADGTYTSGATLKPYLGTGPISISGNAGTPGNVIISTTSANAVSATSAGRWVLNHFRLQTTTSGSGISASGVSQIEFSNLVFGQTVGSHIAASLGAYVIATGNYSVVGGSSSGAHAYAISAGKVVTSGRTVTITGTPSFAASWAWCDRGDGYFEMFGMTFSGSATGTRYNIAMNGVCFVNGGGANYLPGSVGGIVATGGQYA